MSVSFSVNCFFLHFVIIDSDFNLYHVNVLFVNRYPFTVNIEWYADDVPRRVTIKPEDSAMIRDSFRASSSEINLVAFEAWDVANHNNVLMNKRKLFKYNPTLDPTINETVFLSPGMYLYSIFVFLYLLSSLLLSSLA